MNFGKVVGVLKEKEYIPGEHFNVNDKVLFYLSSFSDNTVLLL